MSFNKAISWHYSCDKRESRKVQRCRASTGSKKERERLYVSVSFLPLRVAGKTAILANKADGTATETTTSSLDWQGTGGQRATGM